MLNKFRCVKRALGLSFFCEENECPSSKFVLSLISMRIAVLIRRGRVYVFVAKYTELGRETQQNVEGT